jgi:L-serine dehydratase
MAQAIYGKFNKVDIYLHGSFAEVYEGHCTDVAILAGLLKMESHNKQLPNSFQIAKDQNIEFKFIPTDLGDGLHPNTTKIVFDNDETKAISGASLGGGKAIINYIGKIPLTISLEHSTLILHFNNAEINPQELISLIDHADKQIVNIATGKYKEHSILTFEVKKWFEPADIQVLEEIPGVNWAKFVNHLSNFVNLD